MISDFIAEFTDLSLFSHRLFRAGASSLFAAGLVYFFMPRYINYLRRIDATSDFDNKEKKSPPILGGLLLVLVVIVSTLFFARLNGYSISITLILVAYSAIGSIDDVLKVKNKRLVAKGLLSKKDYQDKADGLGTVLRLSLYFLFSLFVSILAYKLIPGLNRHLTIPLIKPETWYPLLPNWAFIALMCFVTTSTANGANFTDGLDTLVSIPMITTATFIGAVAYISGNAIFSEYLLIPYLQGVDELLPICGAIVGALLAYLWYNSPPAEIYMGDGGSIGLGGAIGMMFVLIKAELFLPIVGIIFLMEAFSSFTQIGYFKITKRLRRDGQGQRVFLRAPIHDHFRLKWKAAYNNDMATVTSKVIWRFHLVSVIALIIGLLIFFKVR